MLKVDKATQTDIKQLRKTRTPKPPKVIKPPKQKQEEQPYIKPLFNISFDE